MTTEDLYEISLAVARAEAELISARSLAGWGDDPALKAALGRVLDALRAVEVPDDL